MSAQTVVIAGAGQAGAQAAVSLRQEGFGGRIVLVGDENALPYQRPPLSKGYLTGKTEEPQLLLRAEKVYADQTVELMLDAPIASIDRAARQLVLASGSRLDYDHLVLALGSRNRLLPVPGAELDGVCYLRTLAEARAVRARMEGISDVVVIGGGFIGLEFAASARTRGLNVTVIEAAPRPMSRVLSTVMSDFLVARHLAQGVTLLTGRGVKQMVGEQGKLAGVELDDGSVVPAQLVVVGIGVLPNVELAAQAGLAADNGIVVDALLQTSDSSISAIGDCAAFPSRYSAHLPKGQIRLESVQNAVDQGRAVASRLAGKPGVAYNAVPWFWSEQYDVRLQMAGITSHHDHVVVRGKPEDNAWSVFCYRDGVFLGAESVNKAQDHMAVRKLLAAGVHLTPEQAADGAFDLKAAAG